MEPLLAGEGDSNSSTLALALIRGAERLRGALHPTTRQLVPGLLDEQLLLEPHRGTSHQTQGYRRGDPEGFL
jgi:hypothetical protein